MTKAQVAKLHSVLQFYTEDKWHTVSGLPICSNDQLDTRRAIIAAYDRSGRLPAVPQSKEK